MDKLELCVVSYGSHYVNALQQSLINPTGQFGNGHKNAALTRIKVGVAKILRFFTNKRNARIYNLRNKSLILVAEEM